MNVRRRIHRRWLAVVRWLNWHPGWVVVTLLIINFVGWGLWVAT